jgi:phosphoribosylformylglycinamidine cyclo-ligase
LIQAAMPTPWQEMFRTFNMGHRLEVYCQRETAEEIIEIAGDFGIKAQIVGRCQEGPNKLTIRHEGQEFVY